MNKQITINGQTIELPFTEAVYLEFIERYARLDALAAQFKEMDGDDRVTLAIGLHLAEKEKQAPAWVYCNDSLPDAVGQFHIAYTCEYWTGAFIETAYFVDGKWTELGFDLNPSWKVYAWRTVEQIETPPLPMTGDSSL